MADTTHTLKFRADSREVKVAGQVIEKAFDPRSPREFRRELGQLQRRLKDITSAQAGLVKELQGVEEGTLAYERLTDQLKSVEDQAKTVKTAIGSITSAFKDFNAERRRGFAAGMAQGLGVAQYIPSEAGMGRRIAGAVTGGAVRRAGGAALAPLRQPGIGGLTTALGAIPIVGEMAAGAIQALSGMYQEAVQYQSARVANLAFIGDVPERGARVMAARMRGLPGGRARAGTGADWDDAMKKSHAQYLQAQKDVTAAEKEAEISASKRIDVSTMTRRERGILKAQIAEEKIRGLTPGRVGAISRGAGLGSPTVTAARNRASRVKVEEAKEREEEARQAFIDESRAFDVRRATVEGRRRRARDRSAFGRFWIPSAGFGIRFGMRAAETQQAFTSYMRARGGAATTETRRPFEAALAAQRVYGISAEQAGAFERMGQAGGGGTGATGLANVLRMATELGLKGSLVPEYLQTLVGLGQTAEKQGVKINEREFGRSSAMMRAIGIRGPQIGRLTGAVGQAAMDLSQRGVSSPVDMIMMRAAGYDPSQGVEGYATAMNKLAGGMDMDTLRNLMSMATAGARGGIGMAGRQTSILMMRRFFGRLKAPIGPGQASTILDAYQQGKLGREHLDMITSATGKSDRRDTHARLVGGARIGVGMVAPLTKTEAALEARRIALGTKMSNVMVTLNTASINAASAVSNFEGELRSVTKWMADLTKSLSEFTKGGAGGVIGKIKSLIGI